MEEGFQASDRTSVVVGKAWKDLPGTRYGDGEDEVGGERRKREMLPVLVVAARMSGRESEKCAERTAEGRGRVWRGVPGCVSWVGNVGGGGEYMVSSSSRRKSWRVPLRDWAGEGVSSGAAASWVEVGGSSSW